MAWTGQEIAQYNPLNYAPLRALYDSERIPPTDPESRARLLAERVLVLGAGDHDLLMRLAFHRGKARSLQVLEEMTMSAHLKYVAADGPLQFMVPIPLQIPVTVEVAPFGVPSDGTCKKDLFGLGRDGV